MIGAGHDVNRATMRLPGKTDAGAATQRRSRPPALKELERRDFDFGCQLKPRTAR